jgi:hypothetical protein
MEGDAVVLGGDERGKEGQCEEKDDGEVCAEHW